jgi:hypothetical protein
MAVLEIEREDEFAPVKNAPGAAEDSPDTARALVLAQHARWLAAAGAVLEGAEPHVAEVSPLLSYAGEGLRAYAGMRIRCPALLLGAGELAADFAAAAARGVTLVPYAGGPHGDDDDGDGEEETEGGEEEEEEEEAGGSRA